MLVRPGKDIARIGAGICAAKGVQAAGSRFAQLFSQPVQRESRFDGGAGGDDDQGEGGVLGSIDGKYGPKTRDVVTFIQAASGISADGIYGPDTRKGD